MKKIILIILIFPSIIVQSQHVYKDRKFIGGSFTSKIKAISTFSFSNFPEDNSPNISTVGYNISLDLKGGYFVSDFFALGGEAGLNFKDDYIGEGPVLSDTAFMQKNYTSKVFISPFIRYYFLIGEQPNEIGSIFLESGYRFGVNTSKTSSKTLLNNNIYSNSYKESFYSHEIIFKAGYSFDLTDFIKHNWFCDVLALEPEIVWVQTFRQFQSNRTDYMNSGDIRTDFTYSYIPVEFNIGLSAYF
tara:strand:+ start:699 stop:1433 length:735 start_codon:yes stop_codon:yes gene_type:complete